MNSQASRCVKSALSLTHVHVALSSAKNSDASYSTILSSLPSELSVMFTSPRHKLQPQVHVDWFDPVDVHVVLLKVVEGTTPPLACDFHVSDWLQPSDVHEDGLATKAPMQTPAGELEDPLHVAAVQGHQRPGHAWRHDVAVVGPWGAADLLHVCTSQPCLGSPMFTVSDGKLPSAGTPGPS